MSLSSLQNQTVTHYSKGSYNIDGRAVVGAGTSIRARVEVKTRHLPLPNGQVKIVDALAFYPSTATVVMNDRVDYNGVKYKVVGISPAIDGDGNTHHIEVELTRYKET